MTRQTHLAGGLAALLMALMTYGAPIGSAQDGTPAATPVASSRATPTDTTAAGVCTGTGFAPGLQVTLTTGVQEEPISAEILSRTVHILARRAAAVSPGGCGILIQDSGTIQVTLAASPTIDNETAVSTLSGSARLEIVDTGGVVPEAGTVLDPAATPGAVAYPVVLSGADITDAYAVLDTTGIWQIGVSLTDDAATRFATYTRQHIGEPLAILLNGEVVSAPVIQSEISGGELVIQGNFTEDDAETLAAQLRAGTLPVTLTVSSVLFPGPGGDSPATPRSAEVAGVETFAIASAQHTTAPVDYAQSPPVGGMHDPQWQTCGFYDIPVRNEHAVHTLEHGVVWITYAPDLPPAQVDALRQIAFIDDRLLISPFPDLDAPVVLSTWDRQLRVDSVDDPRLLDFIAAYAGQSPEPAATCQGGVGTPG